MNSKGIFLWGLFCGLCVYVFLEMNDSIKTPFLHQTILNNDKTQSFTNRKEIKSNTSTKNKDVNSKRTYVDTTELQSVLNEGHSTVTIDQLNHTTKLVNPYKSTSCPVGAKGSKRVCVVLDVYRYKWSTYDSDVRNFISTGKTAYIVGNISQFRSRIPSLPNRMAGIMHVANISPVESSASNSMTAVFTTLLGNKQKFNIINRRREAMHHLNAVLGLNLFTAPSLIRTPVVLPWIKRYIPKSANSKKNANVINTSMFVYDKRQLNETVDYNLYLVYLFLSNCALPMDLYTHEAFSRTGQMIDSYSCFLIEKEMDRTATKYVSLLKNYMFAKERICKVPLPFIKKLQDADDTTSVVPTIGTKFVNIFPFSNDEMAKEIPRQVGEQLDGRVSDLINKYHQLCSPLVSTQVNFLKTTKISSIDVIQRHLDASRPKLMFHINFENGRDAYCKFLHKCSASYLGEGARELMAYYVDRALGLRRFPTTVVRRFFVKDSFPFSLYDEYSSIALNVSEEMFHDFFFKNINVLKNGKKYLDLVLIGTLKDFSRFKGPAIEMLDNLFIARLKNAPSTRFTTNRTYKDMTNIYIFDFICHNWDRAGDNWVKSSFRVTPFDAGNSWNPLSENQSLLCERMVQFPSYQTEKVVDILKINYIKLDKNVADSCKPMPPNYQICRFDKYVVDKIKSQGGSLEVKVRSLLKNDDFGYSQCLEIERHNIFNGIRLRMNYLINYFDTCYKRIGNKMYF